MNDLNNTAAKAAYWNTVKVLMAKEWGIVKGDSIIDDFAKDAADFLKTTLSAHYVSGAPARAAVEALTAEFNDYLEYAYGDEGNEFPNGEFKDEYYAKVHGDLSYVC